MQLIFLKLILQWPTVGQVTLEQNKCDEVDTLIEFVDAMLSESSVEFLPDGDIDDFGHIRAIINALSTNPIKTQNAVEMVKEKASADHKLLATFQAAGSKFLELAGKFAGAKVASHQFLQKVDKVRVDCLAHVDAFNNDASKSLKLTDLVDESMRLGYAFVDACKAKGDDDESSQGSGQAAIAEARQALSNLIDATMKRHFEEESCQWFANAGKKATDFSSLKLLLPPAWGVLQLQKLQCLEDKTLKCIEHTCKFYDITATFVKELDQYCSETASPESMSERSRSTKLCAEFTKWRKAHTTAVHYAGADFGVNTKDLLENFDFQLENIFHTSWNKLMTKPLQKLILFVNLVKEKGFLSAASDWKDLDCIDTDLENVMSDCNDASFVLTGMSYEGRLPLQRAVDYMKNQTDVIKNLIIQKRDENIATTGKVIKSFIDVIKSFSDTELDTAIQKKIKLEIEEKDWK